MSLRIAGMGLVTPLGRGVEHVWEQLLNGEEAQSQLISDSLNKKQYPVFLVPQIALTHLPPHPRLRRSSAISRYAAAAGLDALEDARSTIDNIDMARVALVFAISNGGVSYSKRFYRDLVESGAQSASPLLFPETVFNAAASHLAAILGINGSSYTLVGDGSVGLLAMKMAADLMENDETLDCCLVVGAEEADWLLCDAYHKWRLLKDGPPIEPFHDPPRGTVLSEGAGAIVLARKGAIGVSEIHRGAVFTRRQGAGKVVAEIIRDLVTAADAIIIASANGTFIDLAERNAIRDKILDAIVYAPKAALGESVGASALWQTIIGAQALRTRRLPAPVHLGAAVSGHTGNPTQSDNVIVLSCSLNQQASGLRLSIE